MSVAESFKIQPSDNCRLGAGLKRVAFMLQLVGAWSLLVACTSKTSGETSPKFEQYFIQGKQLYLTHCSNCHQASGKGLGLLYPPLDTSDYMQNHLEDVLCLIRNGKRGELIVNGASYNQAMPGIPALSDLEIAEIATYIYNSWNHQHGLVEVKLVSKILATCDSVTTSP